MLKLLAVVLIMRSDVMGTRSDLEATLAAMAVALPLRFRQFGVHHTAPRGGVDICSPWSTVEIKTNDNPTDA